jgi:hypothetical protein
MRRFFLGVVLSLYFLLNLSAGEVDVKRAGKVAVGFFKYQIESFNIDYQSDISIKNHFEFYSNGEKAIYAFNMQGGGYVLVAADDDVVPVLGYAYTGGFNNENLPPSLNEWLQSYMDQIDYTREEKLQANSEISSLWSKYESINVSTVLSASKQKSVDPLLLCEWNQDNYYNELCPADTNGPGGHVYAGCVALAMAQVMYYYKYPEQGTGSNSYYSYTGYGVLAANFGSTTYNWNAMQNEITGGGNLEIAQLIYHCGVAVEMNYSPNGSGSQTYKTKDALEDYFKYSTSAEHKQKYFYTNTQWKNMIVADINAGRPLIYSGYPSSGAGHAFNLDGYQGSDYFHFNWGWSGSYNGYFYITALNPGSYTFTNGQQAVFGIYPGSNYPAYCSGQTTLTAMQGAFEDGSGPLNYVNNSTCEWLIDPTDLTDYIELDFDYTKLYDDTIIVYDGGSANAPVLTTITANSNPTTVYSNGDKLFIRMLTNGSGTDKGFHATYVAKKPIFCSNTMTLTAATDTFSDGSGQHDYNHSTLCKWYILPSNGQAIKLNFLSFNTEPNADFVRIYDPSTTPSTLIAAFSGSNIPPEINSLSGEMLIVFYSNSSVANQGWEAVYSTFNSIEESNAFELLNIYPNPVSDYMTVSFSSMYNEAFEVVLSSVDGKQIMKKEFISNNGVNKYKIDIPEFAQGIYLLKLTNSKETVTRKIVID